MCGIAGVRGAGGGAAVRAMMDRLAHRGPDAEGIHEGPAGTLGHRRLSIMDPEGGDQPLRDAGGRLALVANGEIYNDRALRARLGGRARYATGNDSESALHLYAAEGPAGTAGLDGMFALAVADGEDLFLARDALGIKPLYTGKVGGALAFASELGALAGIAEEVGEFPPGHWYHSRRGLRRWYEVPDLEPEDRPAEGHAAAVRRVLEASVRKRLRSDVPVGAFLSGGLDSSAVAALAAREVDGLHTFSVGTAGSRDLEAARAASRHIGSVHHERVIAREEVLDALPEIVRRLESFDRDLVRSAIPCWFTSERAAREVKVILTGEGADELFGGYRYHDDYGDDGEALRRELRRSVAALHSMNLQRVDRMTMAHSVEGRVPFLDLAMIEEAQRVPSSLKRRADGNGGGRTEKWILRRACEDLLPREIAWRRKEQFDEGSGTVDLLRDGLERFLPREETADYRAAHPDAALRDHEECAYHRLLAAAFPDPAPVLANVARWTAGRLDAGSSR